MGRAGSHGAGALHIVVERILQDNATFYEINRAGHEFKYAWTDTEWKATVGIPRVADLLYGFGPLQKPIDVLFGGVCSLICEPLGYVAREKSMPMISFGCYSNLLSDKSLYPTHARTAGPFYLVAPMFVAVVKHFKYIRVAVFTGAQAFYSDTAKVIRKELIKTGIFVTDFVILPRTSSRDKPSSITELLTIRRRCKSKMHVDYHTLFVTFTLHRIWKELWRSGSTSTKSTSTAVNRRLCWCHPGTLRNSWSLGELTIVRVSRGLCRR